MGSFFVRELEQCGSLKSVLALYKQDVTQRGMPKDYERLFGMVRTQLEEVRRNKNRHDMENGLNNRGKGLAANTKANQGTTTRKGNCYQYQKHGICSRPSGECPWVRNEQEAAPRRGRGRGGGKGS